MGCFNIIINSKGIPYLETNNVTVSTTLVTVSMGFRNIEPIGEFNVRFATPIPEGTTATLPVSLSLNGTSRPLTYFDGSPVTAGDLVGTGVIKVMNDRRTGILQLMSITTAS